MSRILFLDTSASQTRCFWIERDHEPLVVLYESGNEHAKQIIPALDQLKQLIAPQPVQPEAVAVLNGPGSYTGLRIALSVAKGICYAYQIPLLLLSNLDVIARASKSFGHHALWVMKKAREGEYFCASYNPEGNHILEPQLIHSGSLEALMQAKDYHQVIENEDDRWGSGPFELVYTDPETIKIACLEAFSDKKFADCFLAEPFYLKNVHINKINKL